LPAAAPICRLHRLVCLPCSGVGVLGVSVDGTQAPELSLVVSAILGESNARIAVYSNNTPDSYTCSDS
jgi:hypothetical protein